MDNNWIDGAEIQKGLSFPRRVLAIRIEKVRPFIMSGKISKRLRYLIYAILILAALAIGLLVLPQNLARLQVLKGSIGNDPALLAKAQAALSHQASLNCRDKLALAAIETQVNGKETARPAWEALLSCPEEFSSILKVVFSEDIPMAQKVLAAFPGVAANYFWSAELYYPQDIPQSISLLQQGLKLAPYNAPAWCLLGYSQRKTNDVSNAARSFANCCQYGDPNGTGCQEAGNTFKSLGDLGNAIRFYSLSRLPAVRALGDELR